MAETFRTKMGGTVTPQSAQILQPIVIPPSISPQVTPYFVAAKKQLQQSKPSITKYDVPYRNPTREVKGPNAIHYNQPDVVPEGEGSNFDIFAERTAESTQPNMQFHEWKERGQWGSVHPPEVVVNKQCTHCAIVWRASGNAKMMVSCLQQLWSLSTNSQLEWSYIRQKSVFNNNSNVIAPAFSSDCRYVGFGDSNHENDVHLIAIPRGDAAQTVQLRLPEIQRNVAIEQLAIGPDAKRLCVTLKRFHLDPGKGGSVTTLEHSGRKIDVIAMEGTSVAIYYSESGDVIYSLNILSKLESLYRVYKFDLRERFGQQGALSIIDYQPPFTFGHPLSNPFHSSVYGSGSSASGVVFEGYYVQGRFFSHEQMLKQVILVNLPFQLESKDMIFRFLSDHEHFVMLDGRFLIVDMLKDNGKVLELDNRLLDSNDKIVATFSIQPMPSYLVVGYRDGRLYIVDKNAGYFTVVETEVIELMDCTDLRCFPLS